MNLLADEGVDKQIVDRKLCITAGKWFASSESNVFRRSEIGLNIT